jgi:3-oxoacyl-[acyl-carrier-protein] synthase-1
MTRAVGAALSAARIRMSDVDYRITDINGEHYKFKEAGIALMRFFDDNTPPRLLASGSPQFDLWHPIEYLGEIGATIAPLILGFAQHAGNKGYAPGPVALCHVSDDTSHRGAIVTHYNER